MESYHIDIAVIVVYLLLVLVVGAFFTRFKRSSEEYYLAGRRIRWPFIGSALFASNISAEHYVSYAGGAYLLGIVVGATELVAPINLLFLALFFLPFYIRLKVFTTSEYLERRFNPTCRYILSVNLIIANILTRLSVALWGAAIIMKTIVGWNPVTTVWVMGIITMIYTLLGGLSAVIYTESIQAVIMYVSGIILTALCLVKVGGVGGLISGLENLNLSEHLHWAKDIHHPDLPWTSFTLPWIIVASFYWCMDQTIVQRALSARSLNDARKGAIAAGFLKLFHLFIFVVPGLCAILIFPNLSKPDDAYASVISGVMPAGFRGLALAAVLAALMSTLASALNSTATLVVHDFALRLRPKLSQRRQIVIGGIAIVIVTILGMLWAPYIERFESLWTYLMRISFYLQSPIAGVFILGLISKRPTGAAAVTGIVIGIFIGVTAFLDDLHLIHAPLLGHWLLKPFPHRGLLIVLISAGITILVSCFQNASNRQYRQGLSIDWQNPKILESPAGPLWADWRLWALVLFVFNLFLFIKLI